MVLITECSSLSITYQVPGCVRYVWQSVCTVGVRVPLRQGSGWPSSGKGLVQAAEPQNLPSRWVSITHTHFLLRCLLTRSDGQLTKECSAKNAPQWHLPNLEGSLLTHSLGKNSRPRRNSHSKPRRWEVRSSALTLS